jgi:L-asparagine transporter-like permease
VSQSPFVRVFSHFGFAYAAGFMNFVVITAALSSMNTNIYLCSRMMFSLSRGGYAPARMGSLNRAGVPAVATILTGIFILAAASLSKFTPLAYNDLQGIALFGAILVWMAILLSHLKFRRLHGAADLPVRMPWFPAMQLVGLVLLGALLVTMGLDPAWRISWIVGMPWIALLTIAYFIWKKSNREKLSS